MMERVTSESDLLVYLDQHQIPYDRTEHPPVFTCGEAELYRPVLGGLETKNLFLRDEKRVFYLLVTACSKRIDLKALGRAMGTSKLHFGAPEDLLEMMGLTPGAVTVLGLVNDPDHRIRVLMDAEFWPSAAYWCHPLVNTATLVLDHPALLKFFDLTGHAPEVVEVKAAASF